MPSLSGSFNPKIGPLVALYLTPPALLAQTIQASATTKPQTPAANPAIPVPAPSAGQPNKSSALVHASWALIDTGASVTSVTAWLAAQVKLPLLGKRQIHTAGGIVAVNSYLADIGIPFGVLPQGPAGQPLITNAPTAIIPNRVVLEFQCSSPHFQMLLGRDILCSGIFHMGFDSRFSFSL